MIIFDKKQRIVGLFAFLLVASLQASDDADRAASDPSNIFPSADELDGSGILRDRDAYLQERGWQLGFHDSNPGGGYVGWGEATINTAPSNVRYGQNRIAAVDAAIASAYGQFALSRGRNVTLERVREIVQDPNALTDMQQSTQAQFDHAVQERMRNLETARLDQALRELGVDPSVLPQLDHRQRAELAADRLQNQVVRTAIESFQGIRLLKTFEEQGAVGALIIYSESTRQLANNIVSGNLAAIGRGNSSDALDQLNGQLSDEKLMLMHGIRLLRDANGNPVLVSFGQASPAVTRADSRQRINMAVTAAERQASLRADAAMSEFLNTFFEVNETEISGVSSNTMGEMRGDRSFEVETIEFTERLNTSLRQISTMNLAGSVTARTWRANHPDTGHLYVGVVHLWSPTTEALFTGRARTDSAVSEDGESPGVRRRQSPSFGREEW